MFHVPTMYAIFSLHSIPPIPPSGECTPAEFQSYIISGSITAPYTASFYSNTTTGSLAIWGRSSDFDIMVTVKDPDGIQVGFDDYIYGYIPPGTSELDNCAINISLNKIGIYQIIIESYLGPGNYGKFKTHISPAARLETTWSGYEPVNAHFISSSNYIVMGDNSSTGLLNFYDIDTKTITASYGPPTYITSYGAIYSKPLGRIFSLMYKSSSANNCMVEFDEFGNYINDYPIPTMTWNAMNLAHDTTNDRVFIGRYNFGATGGAFYIIWDCTSRSVYSSGTLDSLLLGLGETAFCTYSEINNSYYVTVNNSFVGTRPTLKMDANTFSSSLASGLQTLGDNITYVSESKQLIISNPIRFANPLTDTITFTDTGATSYILEAAVYDPCENCIVVAVDKYSPPFTSLICYDPTTLESKNYIIIKKDDDPLWNTSYVYTMCFVNSNSRMYIGMGNFTTASLWSVNVSISTGSVIT